MMAFNERVHFFRFYFGKYDPLTPANVERMIQHLALRLNKRFGMLLEPEPIIDDILTDGEIDYRRCYAAIMLYLSRQADRPIWIEYAPMTWRSAPDFLGMFETGKVFHIYRDPRAVLASWAKMSFMPDDLYLNQIFNWIDSINHMRRNLRIFGPERYFPLRFENLHLEPEKTVKAFSAFVGVEPEEQMLQPERWPELFDERYVEANVSAHDGKRKFGFQPALIDNWRKSLEPWQRTLVEVLAREQMTHLGYAVEDKIDSADLQEGVSRLTRQPFLLKNLQTLLATGEGTQELPNDPTAPENWSAGEGYFGKFIDTPEYDAYVSALAEIDRDAENRYQSANFGNN